MRDSTACEESKLTIRLFASQLNGKWGHLDCRRIDTCMEESVSMVVTAWFISAGFE